MTTRDRIMLVAIVLVLGIVGGLGYWLGRPPAPVIETAAPAERQDDGSLIAERRPDAKAKPKQSVPKGGKVERTGSVTVTPPTPEANLRLPGAVPCPPVTVDTSLVRLPDGSKRLLVSSPDGRIDRAVDIPVETAAPAPEPPKWAAGVSYDLVHQTAGAWIERDVGRLRLGAEVAQTRVVIAGPTGIEARLRVGWTF